MYIFKKTENGTSGNLLKFLLEAHFIISLMCRVNIIPFSSMKAFVPSIWIHSGVSAISSLPWVPTEELPMIPTEQLENSLTLSRVIRKDGELLWEIIQNSKGKITKVCIPEYKMENLMGLPYLYKLNPFIGTYELQTEETEASMDEEPIGISGLHTFVLPRAYHLQ